MLKKLATLGAVLAFTAFTLPSLASASSLTSQQISSIVTLLQAFGATSSTIANVQAALTGQPSTSTASASCVSLTSDLYAGETDAQTNGQVSQLQSFLNVSSTGYFGPLTEQAVQNYQSSHGIVSSGSPDTTGYGFVGPVTRGSMGCGSTQNNSQNNGFRAEPVQGSALTESFSTNSTKPGRIDFGDGQVGALEPLGIAAGFGSLHTYGAAGTYTVKLEDSSGNVLGTQTITVTGNQTNQPTSSVSATVDQGSLTTTSTEPLLAGTASGVSQVRVLVYRTSASGVLGTGMYDSGLIQITNGRWSTTVSSYLQPGIYSVHVDDSEGEPALAVGTLTVTGN